MSRFAGTAVALPLAGQNDLALSPRRAPQCARKRYLACILALLLTEGIAAGQARSGNIYGVVLAEDGSVLSGVAVTLNGAGAPQNFVTDRRGEFHSLNLDPADDYALRFDLAGFAAVERRHVAVAVGVNTSIRVEMRPAAVEASVTVVGDAPLLDPRKVGTGATIGRREMDVIPTARDPWVAVQSVPAVLVDKLNVGGNYSGQQSGFIAKGSQTTQGSWNLDGVTVSDMASGASSPTYWDFDSFQEIQAVTGGSDPSIATSGVTLNLVTRRGTNQTHGSARVFATDPAWQARPVLSEEEKIQRDAGGGAFVGNQITGIQDYGLEVGGPALRDRLWLWGAYGRNQIDFLTVSGFPDRTTLEDVNAKLNGQVLPSNALTFFYLRGDKRKQGRDASVVRPPETTWDQKGPSSLYKIEENQVFSSSLVVDAFYSYMDEGFQLVAEGGDRQVYQDLNAVWHNSFASSYFKRPQHSGVGTANYFFSTGLLGHEIKFGASYRDAPVMNRAIWPGGEIIAFRAGSGACSVDCGAITRPSNGRVDLNYYSTYLSDTITADRLTISAGLRYDYQKEDVQRSSVPGNPLYPNILADASAPELKNVILWRDVSPRLGATYAFGPRRRTLARFSYARYANQLGSYPGNQLSAIPGVAYAYYPWTDANGNNLIDPGEIDTSGKAIKTSGFDPANPSSPTSVNSIASNLKSQKTDEIVVGGEHELLPSLAVGVTYTYRRYKDFYFSYRTGLTRDNYVLHHMNSGTLPDGMPFSVPIYSISGAVPPGFFFTNRPDYTQTFNGLEMTFNKRLSGGWMARGSFAYNNPRQHVGPRACVDPTNTTYNSGEDFVPGGCEDGGIVAPLASSYLHSAWQFDVNAAYQAPLGLTVAGHFYGRQGSPIAYFVRDNGSADRLTRNVYVTAVDGYRYDSVLELDLRLQKDIPVTAAVSAALSVDVFNVLNRNTVLRRNARLGLASPATGTNTILETQSPRIVRFGGRISF